MSNAKQYYEWCQNGSGFADACPLRHDAPVEALVMHEIAANLHTKMSEIGISQAEISRQTGCAQTTISRLLAGKVLISVALLHQLNVLFGVHLLQEEDIPKVNWCS